MKNLLDWFEKNLNLIGFGCVIMTILIGFGQILDKLNGGPESLSSNSHFCCIYGNVYVGWNNHFCSLFF
jgi:hypothetical protein